jgi:hypothetical protein
MSVHREASFSSPSIEFTYISAAGGLAVCASRGDPSSTRSFSTCPCSTQTPLTSQPWNVLPDWSSGRKVTPPASGRCPYRPCRPVLSRCSQSDCLPVEHVQRRSRPDDSDVDSLAVARRYRVTDASSTVSSRMSNPGTEGCPSRRRRCSIWSARTRSGTCGRGRSNGNATRQHEHSHHQRGAGRIRSPTAKIRTNTATSTEGRPVRGRGSQ